jgi:hypothetical protein
MKITGLIPAIQLVGGEGRMTEEKIIYLGPEEEMTNVRERLENIDAGYIILVIPPQTHLRSHVGWRLLHSRVRELGHDVLIISSDRQIRAVAKAAGFRVADSLESSPSDKPRPDNRSVRSDMGGKRTSQGSNKQVSNRNKTSRSLKPGQQQMPTSSKSNKKSRVSNGSQNQNWESVASTSSRFEIEDVPYDSHQNLPIETVPSPQYNAEVQEDGEVDSLVEDYYVARSIREAAQSSASNQASSAIDDTESSSGTVEQSSKIPQPGEIEDDPLGYMEDIQPTALPEQRASTYIHDINQDVPDVPTDVYEEEIEDLGDGGGELLRDDWPSPPSEEHMLVESEEEEAPRTYDMTPTNSQMVNTVRPSLEDLGNEDDLLPPSSEIEDRPTRVTPPAAPKREPQPIIQPSSQARKVTGSPTTQQTSKPVTTKTSRVVTTPPLVRKASLKTNRNGKKILAISSISLGVLLLAFLLFIYFGSNATVTVVVPSQSVSVTNQYVANMNQQSGQQNAIPSQVLIYTANATGQGTASGTSMQGNQVASGIVTFSNKGSKPLDIPTGTVLSTNSSPSVQFATVADVYVPTDQSNNGIPSIAPVQAQLPGQSGNVPQNSITIIPPDSLAKIGQNNQGVTPTPANLTVTNTNPTTGGGATNVTAVSSSDAKALAAKLQQQVQNEVKVWLKNSVHPGDVAGPPVPNVLASTTPLPEETFTTTPAVGQPAPGGKFSGVLTAKVSMLVIRNASIQVTGRSQLMAHALHMNPPTVVATSLPVTVKVIRSTPSKDGKSLTLIVESAGHVVQQVPAQQISQQLAGKSVDQAKTFINSGQAGITGVVTTNIEVFPPFLGFMPFRPEQIHLVIQPGPVKNATNG